MTIPVSPQDLASIKPSDECLNQVQPLITKSRRFPFTPIPLEYLVQLPPRLQSYYVEAVKLEQRLLRAGVAVTEGYTALCPAKVLV